MAFGEVGFAALSLAVAFSLPPLYISIPMVIITAFIVMLISQKKGASGDVSIALVSAIALAFGVIVTSLTKGFNIDVSSYMFGSILSMTKTDVILSIILSVILIAIYILLYNRLFMITYDEKYAKACRYKCNILSISNFTYYIFSSGFRNENDGNIAYI